MAFNLGRLYCCTRGLAGRGRLPPYRLRRPLAKDAEEDAEEDPEADPEELVGGGFPFPALGAGLFPIVAARCLVFMVFLVGLGLGLGLAFAASVANV